MAAVRAGEAPARTDLVIAGRNITRRLDNGPVIWVEDPDRPTYPIELLDRIGANSRLFDILAALIPDRTDEEEPA